VCQSVGETSGVVEPRRDDGLAAFVDKAPLALDGDGSQTFRETRYAIEPRRNDKRAAVVDSAFLHIEDYEYAYDDDDVRKRARAAELRLDEQLATLIEE